MYFERVNTVYCILTVYCCILLCTTVYYCMYYASFIACNFVNDNKFAETLAQLAKNHRILLYVPILIICFFSSRKVELFFVLLGGKTFFDEIKKYII